MNNKFYIFFFQLISQAKGSGNTDTICFDIHAISELQEKKIPTTDDSPKYAYKAVSNGKKFADYSQYPLL